MLHVNYSQDYFSPLSCNLTESGKDTCVAILRVAMLRVGAVSERSYWVPKSRVSTLGCCVAASINAYKNYKGIYMKCSDQIYIGYTVTISEYINKSCDITLSVFSQFPILCRSYKNWTCIAVSQIGIVIIFCHSLFIPYPSSSIRSSAQLVLILCWSYSVSE